MIRPQWLDDYITGDRVIDERPDVIKRSLIRHIVALEQESVQYKKAFEAIHVQVACMSEALKRTEGEGQEVGDE